LMLSMKRERTILIHTLALRQSRSRSRMKRMLRAIADMRKRKLPRIQVLALLRTLVRPELLIHHMTIKTEANLINQVLNRTTPTTMMTRLVASMVAMLEELKHLLVECKHMTALARVLN